jgi:hypothetical protein
MDDPFIDPAFSARERVIDVEVEIEIDVDIVIPTYQQPVAITITC